MRCAACESTSFRVLQDYEPHGTRLVGRGHSIGPGRSVVIFVSPQKALTARRSFGAVDAGEPEIENALWRIDSAYEKLHDLFALGLGVPTLRLRKDRKGILRFESDRRRNRRKLREVDVPAAKELLTLDKEIFNHRGLELRHQVTHSLAPIRAWRSFI